MAGLELMRVLTEMARERPIFHNKADLKDALVKVTKRLCPVADVELDYRPFAGHGWRLDLWMSEAGRSVAVHMAYPTRAFCFRTKVDRFDLKTQGACDQHRYDFWRSVSRLEHTVRVGAASAGCALLLTNDHLYWTPSARPLVADEAFHLHDGCTRAGRLAWTAKAGPGTTAGREEPVDLVGTYRPSWADYACLSAEGAGTFRYLLLTV